MTEADQQALQSSRSHRLAPADTLECLEDLCLLHQPLRPEWCSVAEERAHGPCRLRPVARPSRTAAPDRTADRCCCPGSIRSLRSLTIGCTVTPPKWSAPHFLGDRALDGLIRLADCGFVLQVELDSTDIGLVSDGVGENLEYDGNPICAACCARLHLRCARFASRPWECRSAKELLGFELVQQQASALANVWMIFCTPSGAAASVHGLPPDSAFRTDCAGCPNTATCR